MAGRKNQGGRANWASRDQNDFYRCFNEAEELYLIGCDLETISKQLRVTVERLQNWKERYIWDRKKAAVMETHRGIGAMLREHLRKEVEATLAKPDVSPEDLENIGKKTALISKIEAGGTNLLAATLEVLKGFSVWIRKNCDGQEEYNLVSAWVQNYLKALTDV